MDFGDNIESDISSQDQYKNDYEQIVLQKSPKLTPISEFKNQQTLQHQNENQFSQSNSLKDQQYPLQQYPSKLMEIQMNLLQSKQNQKSPLESMNFSSKFSSFISENDNIQKRSVIEIDNIPSQLSNNSSISKNKVAGIYNQHHQISKFAIQQTQSQIQSTIARMQKEKGNSNNDSNEYNSNLDQLSYSALEENEEQNPENSKQIELLAVNQMNYDFIFIQFESMRCYEFYYPHNNLPNLIEALQQLKCKKSAIAAKNKDYLKWKQRKQSQITFRFQNLINKVRGLFKNKRKTAKTSQAQQVNVINPALNEQTLYKNFMDNIFFSNHQQQFSQNNNNLSKLNQQQKEQSLYNSFMANLHPIKHDENQTQTQEDYLPANQIVNVSQDNSNAGLINQKYVSSEFQLQQQKNSSKFQ